MKRQPTRLRWFAARIEFYLGDSWKLKKNLTLDYGIRWSFYREPYSYRQQLGKLQPGGLERD